jgi:ankyrin repeat protein
MKTMRSIDHSLKIASMMGNLDKVAKLLEAGADINAQDSIGYTALHYAVDSEYPDVCQFLIEKGARLNIRSEEGFTPLHLAANFGLEDIARMLLKAGASPLIRSSAGKTAKDLVPSKDSQAYRTILRAQKRKEGK